MVYQRSLLSQNVNFTEILEASWQIRVVLAISYTFASLFSLLTIVRAIRKSARLAKEDWAPQEARYFDCLCRLPQPWFLHFLFFILSARALVSVAALTINPTMDLWDNVLGIAFLCVCVMFTRSWTFSVIRVDLMGSYVLKQCIIWFLVGLTIFLFAGMVTALSWDSMQNSSNEEVVTVTVSIMEALLLVLLILSFIALCLFTAYKKGKRTLWNPEEMMYNQARVGINTNTSQLQHSDCRPYGISLWRTIDGVLRRLPQLGSIDVGENTEERMMFIPGDMDDVGSDEDIDMVPPLAKYHGNTGASFPFGVREKWKAVAMLSICIGCFLIRFISVLGITIYYLLHGTLRSHGPVGISINLLYYEFGEVFLAVCLTWAHYHWQLGIRKIPWHEALQFEEARDRLLHPRTLSHQRSTDRDPPHDGEASVVLPHMVQADYREWEEEGMDGTSACVAEDTFGDTTISFGDASDSAEHPPRRYEDTFPTSQVPKMDVMSEEVCMSDHKLSQSERVCHTTTEGEDENNHKGDGDSPTSKFNTLELSALLGLQPPHDDDAGGAGGSLGGSSRHTQEEGTPCTSEDSSRNGAEEKKHLSVSAPVLRDDSLVKISGNASQDGEWIIHSIDKHDTIAGIALRYGVDVSSLRAANRAHGHQSDAAFLARRTIRIPMPSTPACTYRDASDDDGGDDGGTSSMAMMKRSHRHGLTQWTKLSKSGYLHGGGGAFARPIRKNFGWEAALARRFQQQTGTCGEEAVYYLSSNQYDIVRAIEEYHEDIKWEKKKYDEVRQENPDAFKEKTHYHTNRGNELWLDKEPLCVGGQGSVHMAFWWDAYYNEGAQRVLVKCRTVGKRRAELDELLLMRNAMKDMPPDTPVVKVLDFVYITHESTLLLVVELCSLGDLRTYMKSNKVTRATRLGFACQIARGLAYLHSVKIMHGDVKLSNVFLAINRDSTSLVAKIGDFGLSVLLQSAQRMRGFRGTLSYMAPEVKEGRPHGFAADVWSFGCLLERLRISKSFPEIRRLIQQCKDSNPPNRPVFDEVVVQLEEILENTRNRRLAARAHSVPNSRRKLHKSMWK